MAKQPPKTNEGHRSIAGASFKRRLDLSLGIIAGLLLLLLVLITCIDVVGRYLLNAPLAGAFELTEVVLVALVFAALPLATERREHVEVDLLAHAFGRYAGRMMILFGNLFMAVVLIVLAWRLWIYAMKSALDGGVTNALSIPLAPFGYFAAAACFLSALIAVLRGFHPPFFTDTPSRKEEGTL